MVIKLVEASLLISNSNSVQLTRTEFKYSPDQSKPFDEITAVAEITSAPGWLGLKTGTFEDWENTRIIDLSYPGGRNGNHVFNVDFRLNKPEKKGQWLLFPVTTQDDITWYRD